MQAATGWLMNNALKNPENAGAASVDYLRLFGIVVTGWMWARMAKIALDKKAAAKGTWPSWTGSLPVPASGWSA